VWPKRRALIQRMLRRTSFSELRAIHAQLGDVDAMVKGAMVGDPWDLLTEVSLRLAGHAITPLVSRTAY